MMVIYIFCHKTWNILLIIRHYTVGTCRAFPSFYTLKLFCFILIRFTQIMIVFLLKHFEKRKFASRQWDGGRGSKSVKIRLERIFPVYSVIMWIWGLNYPLFFSFKSKTSCHINDFLLSFTFIYMVRFNQLGDDLMTWKMNVPNDFLMKI